MLAQKREKVAVGLDDLPEVAGGVRMNVEGNKENEQPSPEERG